MENLKIDLCGLTDKEKQNAVWWLNELGFSTGFKSIDFYSYLYGCVGSQAPYDKTIQFGNSSKTFSRNTGKEITLPDLRDMVVLKRNSIDDATHTDGHYSFYVGKDKNYFFSSCDKAWRGTWKNVDILKPIEKKEMKEYLDKQQDGTYKLIKADGGCIDRDWIEIPTGAEKYIQLSGNNRSFYKNGFKESWCSGKWLETACNKENLKTWNGFPVLWQRNQEPKQAEFLVKTDSGYVLQVLDENAGGEDVVRIPDGVEIAIEYTDGRIYFWAGKDSCKWVDGELIKSKYPDCLTSKQFLDEWPNSKVLWKRETLNDQVASAEEYRNMISNAAIVGLTSVVTGIAQSCSGVGVGASLQDQSDFPLNNYELNHRVAKAFNAVRETNLNEDDVNYIRELIDLTVSHYGERK